MWITGNRWNTRFSLNSAVRAIVSPFVTELDMLMEVKAEQSSKQLSPKLVT